MAKSKGPATPVKANRATVSSGSTEKSVDVRKIANGYIVRESTYGPRGDYKSTERFSPTAPTIKIAPAKK